MTAPAPKGIEAMARPWKSLGHKNIKTEDGSWTEYGSLAGVPIEVGK